MSEINYIKELSEGIFPITLKLIEQYQQKDLSLKDKFEMGTYHEDTFYGGSNVKLRLITFEGNIVILPILQYCVLNWYHEYLLYPGMDMMEVIIFQHMYSPGIIIAVNK